jgi:hypothetical protein
VLIVVGLQVPVIPFIEVVGKSGGVSFTHRAGIGGKIGVTIGLTVITAEA